MIVEQVYSIVIQGFSNHQKMYFIKAFSEYEAERAVLSAYRTEFPAMTFFANIKK